MVHKIIIIDINYHETLHFKLEKEIVYRSLIIRAVIMNVNCSMEVTFLTLKSLDSLI